MPSQTEQVAAMLRAGPVCSYADVPLWMPNFRSRVSDLRRKGWVIEGRWCRREHDPKRGAHKEYVWQPPPVVYPYTATAGHPPPPSEGMIRAALGLAFGSPIGVPDASE